MWFEHLPASSFLALPPKNESVKTFHNHVEIRIRAHKIFEELVSEKDVLAKAVSSLNMVRRKGKLNIHSTELSEDDFRTKYFEGPKLGPDLQTHNHRSCGTILSTLSWQQSTMVIAVPRDVEK
ncbi:hypothetical protein DFH09DRAFT_1100610 [Mycena vulgaris]|nr:hypothetical protein DFH09DRAFT_1100610 [Mycena vulgaris]